MQDENFPTPFCLFLFEGLLSSTTERNFLWLRKESVEARWMGHKSNGFLNKLPFPLTADPTSVFPPWLAWTPSLAAWRRRAEGWRCHVATHFLRHELWQQQSCTPSPCPDNRDLVLPVSHLAFGPASFTSPSQGYGVGYIGDHLPS